MPIISDYTVFGHSKNGEIIIESNQDFICPECKKGILKKRCRVRRHIRKEITGDKVWYLIPVGKCDNASCCKQLRLLPDFMVPYKHFESKAISDVRDEKITRNSPVVCPSVRTMQSWLAWFEANLILMEGILRSVGYRVLGFGEELLFSELSLVDQLRLRSKDWFKKITRFIYNSGHQLMPI